ncbi:MAG: hypothetical protein RR865_11060, partial [Clostridia bacterium]
PHASGAESHFRNPPIPPQGIQQRGMPIPQCPTYFGSKRFGSSRGAFYIQKALSAQTLKA